MITHVLIGMVLVIALFFILFSAYIIPKIVRARRFYKEIKDNIIDKDDVDISHDFIVNYAYSKAGDLDWERMKSVMFDRVSKDRVSKIESVIDSMEHVDKDRLSRCIGELSKEEIVLLYDVLLGKD